MEKAEERLALRIFHEQVVEFKPTPLKHHENEPNAPLSPIFFNLRTENNPGKKGPLSHDLVSNIGRVLYSQIIKSQIHFHYVVGVPWAGEPFAEAVCFTNRLFSGRAELIKLIKKEEENGSRKIIGIVDGYKITPGSRALLVDDLITKSYSKLEAIRVLEAAGLKVKDILVVIDREQGGEEELKKEGYNLRAIYKISDLLMLYLNKGIITRQKHDEVMEYIYVNR